MLIHAFKNILRTTDYTHYNYYNFTNGIGLSICGGFDIDNRISKLYKSVKIKR